MERSRSDEIRRRERAESAAATLKALRAGTTTGLLSQPTSIAALFGQVKGSAGSAAPGIVLSPDTGPATRDATATDTLLQLANAAAR